MEKYIFVQRLLHVAVALKRTRVDVRSAGFFHDWRYSSSSFWSSREREICKSFLDPETSSVKRYVNRLVMDDVVPARVPKAFPAPTKSTPFPDGHTLIRQSMEVVISHVPCI